MPIKISAFRYRQAFGRPIATTIELEIAYSPIVQFFFYDPFLHAKLHYSRAQFRFIATQSKHKAS